MDDDGLVLGHIWYLRGKLGHLKIGSAGIHTTDNPRTVSKYIRVFVFWTACNSSKLLRILFTFLKIICDDKPTDGVLKRKTSGKHVMLNSFLFFPAQCSACFLIFYLFKSRQSINYRLNLLPIAAKTGDSLIYCSLFAEAKNLVGLNEQLTLCVDFCFHLMDCFDSIRWKRQRNLHQSTPCWSNA